jgi:hypothetical protein
MYNNFMMGFLVIFNLLACKLNKVDSFHISLCLPLIHNKMDDSKTTKASSEEQNGLSL